MNRRIFLRLAGLNGGAALAGSVPALDARGAMLGSVHFVDELFVSDLRLKLRGTGLYYYKIFIKVAAVGLYLDEKAAGGDVLGDVAKRLEMQYFWGVKAADLAKGSDAILERNLSAEQRGKIKAPLAEMYKLYRDVSAGDRCAFMYIPGAGTSLLLNGKRLGTVPGVEFAAAYFSMWFGEKPLDGGLKQRLLGEG